MLVIVAGHLGRLLPSLSPVNTRLLQPLLHQECFYVAVDDPRDSIMLLMVDGTTVLLL